MGHTMLRVKRGKKECEQSSNLFTTIWYIKVTTSSYQKKLESVNCNDLSKALGAEGILMCFVVSCWQMVPSDYTKPSNVMKSWILHPVEN